jgi:Na+-transporting methylmalonyl-CoA/oxaloacetate decarboxylase gamma subunit
MIGQALEVMLFGMLGIFLVMGLVIISIVLLGKLGRNEAKKADAD